MVKLRLKRLGRKKRPFYRIVAMDANAPQSGQALEEIGTYDPVGAIFNIDADADLQWLRNGAQMSETVHDLMKSQGVLAKHAGAEATAKEGALSQNKPKRRKKLAAASSAPAAEPEAAAPAEVIEETPAVAVAEEAAVEPAADAAEATEES